MCFGEPDIAAFAQSAAADRLRVRAFDPGARGIISLELFRRLTPAGGVQRLVVLARLQPNDPWLVLGPGAAGA